MVWNCTRTNRDEPHYPHFFLEFAGETEFNFLMFYQNDPGGGVSGRDREVLCDIVIFHRLHGTRIVSAVSTESFFFAFICRVQLALIGAMGTKRHLQIGEVGRM